MTDEEKKEFKCLKEKIEMNKLYGIDIYLNKEQVKIIENLFKEIEELKAKNKILEAISLSFNEIQDRDKKWKAKIKAKIEECREILYSFEKELELKANKDKFIYKESMNCLLGQISVLQSLLEKE